MKKLIFNTGTIVLLIFTVSPLLAQVPNYVPTSGLIGWYPFNGNTNDESGNANHGIDYGLKLDTDRYGNPNSSYYFDSLAMMTIDTSQSLNQIDSVFTISFWMKEKYTPLQWDTQFDSISTGLCNGGLYPPPGSSNLLILWLGDSLDFSWNWPAELELSIQRPGATSTGNYYYYTEIGGSNEFFEVLGDATLCWTHSVLVYDKDTVSLYFNGNLCPTFFWPAFSNAHGNNKWNGMPINFGYNGATLFYCPEYYHGLQGQLDDIGIWNRALTGQEINNLYNSSTCTPTFSTLNEIACESFELNGTVYDSAGTYQQVLTNAEGCDSTITLNLSFTGKPDFVSLGTERTTALCPNDSVKIFVVNPKGPGLTYQWYKSDAVISGAVDSFFYANEVRKYKVKVSAGGSGCERMSGRIQPTVAIPPSVSITPQGSTDICSGDSVLLVANYVPGYSYQWRRYGADIPGANDTMYYASQPGNYKIFITNDGGCISKSSNVSVNIVCRLAGSSVANDVEVMPNPTSDNFSVKLNDLGEEVPVSVEFIDQQGRIIESRRVNGQTLIDFTAMGLSNGNYTVIVRFESGETVEKVVSVVR